MHSTRFAVIALVAVATAAQVPLTELFHQLDERLPHGQYRIPGLVQTTKGTLLAFVQGRMHRTDATPTIVYMRRSTDGGATWAEPVPILSDPTNRTDYLGEPIVDPATGAIHFLWSGDNGTRCSACYLHITSSADDGLSWAPSRPLPMNRSQPANASWGGLLASGIALARGEWF